jgi:hypothetical protein
VSAGDLDDTTVKFGGLGVENAKGEQLGTVDGFIIDVDTARPYYVVVDSGGWFKSKHYLVPVGHARLDSDRGLVLADHLTRDRIKRFPGFDKAEFEKLSDQELEQLAQSTASACCMTDIVIVSDVRWSEWQHYEQPDWWQSNYYRPDRAGAAGVTAGAEMPSPRETSQRDHEPALTGDSTSRRE